jgi:hypothetical protein
MLIHGGSVCLFLRLFFYSRGVLDSYTFNFENFLLTFMQPVAQPHVEQLDQQLDKRLLSWSWVV